jgi:hypothetical protein
MECPRCGSRLTASSSKGNGGMYYYYHCIRGCKERIKAKYKSDIEKLIREKVAVQKKKKCKLRLILSYEKPIL